MGCPAHTSLEKYLHELARCQELLKGVALHARPAAALELTAQYGIYDNFPVLLRADHETVSRDLAGCMDFAFARDLGAGTTEYSFNPGTVVCILHAGAESVPGLATGNVRGESSRNLQELQHFRFQGGTFSTAMMLHPYQERKIPGTDWRMAIAQAVQAIGEYALRTRTPLCFPESRGWDHLDDFSRTVYYLP